MPKSQFNQKLNSRLRRLIHFRPHGILRRSFENYIKRLSFISRAGFASSATLFIISLLIIFPVYYKANLAEAAGSLSDATLSITSDNLTAGVDLLVTSDSGTFASSASPMSFNVTTNNVTGYMLSISAKSGTDLTNSTAGTSFTSLDATNPTIAAGITADAFGNASNTAYNNQWGFKPNYYKSTVNSDKFYPSPTTSGVTLNKTDSANTSGLSDTYTIAIGARATYSQVAGTYSNTYILSSVGNYPIYKITYMDTTGDSTVANLPAEQKPSSDSTAITVKLSSTTPTRTGYTFSGWCTANTTTCSNDNKYNPGDTYNLSTLNANTVTLYATWTINQYTCTKQYRLQNADGTFPSTYTLDTTEQINYNATCTYTKNVTNYKYGSATATNGASGTKSGTMGINGLTLSLDFYRNTYALTVSAGSNTSNATGSGTYRWGQTVTVGVTKANNTTCISYATPTWSRTAGVGSLNSTSGTSVTFTMSTGTATVTATSTSSNIAQTITLSRPNGYATGITIAGTNYTGTSASLACGTYNVSPTGWSSGYEFSSWGTSGSISLGSSTTTASNTLTVNGVGTLTLNGKVSCDTTVSGTMQDFNPCSTVANGTSGSLTDSRDNQIYTVKKINGQWWMTRNLAIGCNGSGVSYGSSVSSKSLTSSNSNISTTRSTPTALLSTKANNNSVSGYTTPAMQCDVAYGAWYNYATATANTITGGNNSATVTEDICPLNWHLPTGPHYTNRTDLNKLVGNTTTDWQSPTDGLKAFDAVAGGYYFSGSLYDTGYGYWWSATASDISTRYYLTYDSGNGKFNGYGTYRYIGYYVRCVHG